MTVPILEADERRTGLGGIKFPTHTERLSPRMKQSGSIFPFWKIGTFFYDIYTDEEKAADSRKADTGLFFFWGTRNEKFAVACSGGTWAYIWAMYHRFPHALKLSKRGYTALQSYTVKVRRQIEDLSQEISFIFAHAGESGVDSESHSVWCGRMAARSVLTVSNLTAAQVSLSRIRRSFDTRDIAIIT